jgi:hypothetical protein
MISTAGTNNIGDITFRQDGVFADGNSLFELGIWESGARTVPLEATTAGVTILKDLIVDGGNIGITANPDLITLQSSAFLLEGHIETETTSDNLYIKDDLWSASGINSHSIFKRRDTSTVTADGDGFDLSFKNESSAGEIDLATLSASQNGSLTTESKFGINIWTGGVKTLVANFDGNGAQVTGDIEASGDFVNSGSTGISGTYSFNGVSSGDVTQITFTGGIATNIVVVP